MNSRHKEKGFESDASPSKPIWMGLPPLWPCSAKNGHWEKYPPSARFSRALVLESDFGFSSSIGILWLGLHPGYPRL